MIVDGRIHGGLTMGMAPALLEEISYDESGNIQGGSFMEMEGRRHPHRHPHDPRKGLAPAQGERSR